MTQKTLRSQTLPELLNINERQLYRIRVKIMFAVFLSYVTTEAESPVDTAVIGRSLPQEFDGNELVCAAYIFGAIEQETQKGENFDLLDSLKTVAEEIYHTTDLSLDQFETTCKTYTRYYLAKEKVAPIKTL